MTSTLTFLKEDYMFAPSTSDNALFLPVCISKNSLWEEIKMQVLTLPRPWHDSRMQSWSELECDTDFLGTTGRREVQLAHKQEMAEATTQWGFLFIPLPTIRFLTSHLVTSVSHLKSYFSSCPLNWPPTVTTFPNPAHISHFTSSFAPCRPTPSSHLGWAKSRNQNKKL